MHKYLDWYNIALYSIVVIGSLFLIVVSFILIPASWIMWVAIIFLALVIAVAIEEIGWEIRLAKALEEQDNEKIATLWDEHNLKD